MIHCYFRCSSESAARLKSTAKQTIEKDGIVPTILCTHTDDVEHINMRSLDKLPGESPTMLSLVIQLSFLLNDSLSQLSLSLKAVNSIFIEQFSNIYEIY